MNRPRRNRLPKPPEPPAGHMNFYWAIVSIAAVERHAKRNMGSFDSLPKRMRDRLNGDDISGPARGRDGIR